MVRSVRQGGVSGIRRWTLFRLVSWILLLTYCSDSIGMGLLRMREAHAQSFVMAAPPGALLSASPVALPPSLKAISIDPSDPLKINFLVDAGDHVSVKAEDSDRLVKYFLTFLTIPEKDLWVNLSPFEPDRIVNSELGGTTVGEDMLKEDYLLKQLAASITFPDREPGRFFWEQIYSKIHAQYGEVDLPLNTFSKVWVIPENAVVYEQQGTAFISESRLKVMIDEDYFAGKKGLLTEVDAAATKKDQVDGLYLTIAREIIIPELEREVNEGQYFVQLRQMFNSLILAIWFKRKLREHVINQVYSDKKKVSGIQIEDKQVTQKIYDQYMGALKKGVYNIIREDYDHSLQEVVPRHYFSGGFSFKEAAGQIRFYPVPSDQAQASSLIGQLGNSLFRFSISLIPKGMSRKNFLGLAVAAGFFFSPAMSGAQELADVQLNNQPVANIVQQAPKNVISRGAGIAQEDRKYFSFMKDFLNSKDVQAIQGQVNPLTGRAYAFDAGYIKRNWERVFSSSRMGWAQEAVVIVAQNKLGIREDGRLGPQTRKALEKRMMAGVETVPQPIAQAKEASALDVLPGPAAVEDQAPAQPEQAPAQPEQAPDFNAAPFLDVPASPAARPEQEPLQPEEAPDFNIAPLLNVPAKPAASQEQEEVGQDTSEPPAIPKTDVDTSASLKAVQDSQVYTFSSQTAVTPEEVSFFSQTNGIVSGFNKDKRDYVEGDIIFKLENPEIRQKRLELKHALIIERSRLGELQRLIRLRAATRSEILPVEEKVEQLAQQLMKFDQESLFEEVKAPCRLTLKNTFVSNGMTVNKGVKIFEYQSPQRVKVRVEMPLKQTYFGAVRHFKIDGQEVSQILNVEWNFNPQKTKAVVTFLVTSTVDFPGGKNVNVEAEIHPVSNAESFVNPGKGDAHTVTAVRKTEAIVVVAPGIGEIAFHVKEGDKVKKGQLLAVQASTIPEEYNRMMIIYNNINAQLQQAEVTQGVRYIPRDQIAGLQSKKASLLAQLSRYKQQIERLNILAPEDGIVTSVSSMTASSFREGDEIVKLKSVMVRLGNVNDSLTAVMFPNNIDIQIDDPVLIQIPNGQFVPGRVSNVNRTPVSGVMALGAVQSLEVTAQDSDYVLWENLPVQVIIPKEADKIKVVEKLLEGEKQIQEPFTVSDQPVPQPLPRKLAQKVVHQTNRYTDQGTGVLSAAASSMPQGRQVGLEEMTRLVVGNELLNGDIALDVLKQKASEGLVNSSRFSLNAGMFMTDGKLAFSGGLGGMIQGVMAQVSSGDAIGAALPIIFNLSGHLMDLISGKNERAQEVATLMTRIAQHHMEAAIAQQVHQATSLWINIGQAQKNIEELGLLNGEIEKALQVVTARELGAFSVTAEKNELNRKLSDARAKISSWQEKKGEWTIELNHMLKQPLTEEVSPALIWEGEFPRMTEQERAVLFARIDNNDSGNYRIKEAQASSEAMEKTIELQELELLPSVDLHSLYLSDGEKYNPLYDLVSGAAIRTSSLQQGNNASIQFELALIDTARDLWQAMAAFERNKTQLNMARVKAEVEKELTMIGSKIQELSRQIEDEEAAYARSCQSWGQKRARPDIFRVDQSIQERIQMSESIERLIDLKAQYLKAESGLRQLQLLKTGETRVLAEERDTSVKGRAVAAVVDSIAKPQVERAEQGASYELVQSYPLNQDHNKYGVVHKTGDMLSAGFVSYPVSSSSTGLWLLMNGALQSAGNGSDAIVTILTEDPNIITRTQTLDMLLEQRQNSRKFPVIAEQIILSSPYPDVVQKLLLFMANKGGGDIRFVINIIDRAIQKKDALLTERCFHVLSDILQDPAVVQGLSELNYTSGLGTAYTHSSSETVRKGLLTFLSWAPEDSIARTRLLQSNYWSSEQLAHIYVSLTLNPGKDSDELALWIYDEILRREALRNVNEVYSKGPFEERTAIPFINLDIYVAYMMDRLKEMTVKFLTTSPDWRQMRKFISPKLYVRAEEATKALIKTQKSSVTKENEPLYVFSKSPVNAVDPLAHFTALGFDAGKAYIAQTRNLPELARILEMSSSFRSMAFDKLMMTTEGLVLVLQAYVSSNDPELFQLVEEGNWMDVLRKDVVLMEDTAVNGVLRRSMEKMHDKTKEAWTLNVSLETYSFLELQANVMATDDVLSRAQRDAMATEMALGVVSEISKRATRMHAGETLYDPEEISLIDEIHHRIVSEDSPEAIRAYLTQLEMKQNPKTKKLLNHITKTRDEISSIIVHQDIGLPSIPVFYQVIKWIVGIGALLFSLKFLRSQTILNHGSSEMLINELHRELSVERKKSNFNWWKETFLFWLPLWHTDAVISIPEQGLTVDTSASLKRWQNLVEDWKRSGAPLDPQKIANDFNNILNHAFIVLVKTAYTPELMGKVNGLRNETALNEPYQAVLSYFNLLSIETLNALKLALSNSSDLSPYNRAVLLKDSKIMIQMMRYVTIYLKILEYRGIIDKVMGYKFSDSNWIERFKIYPAIRSVLFYSYLWRNARKGLLKDIPELLRQGELLMPGLYGASDDNTAMIQSSKSILEQCTKAAYSLSSPLKEKTGFMHKVRSFFSRLRLMALPIYGLGVFLLSLVGGFTIAAAPSVIAIVGFIIGVLIFWIPHKDIMQMYSSKVMNRVIDKFDLSVSSLFGGLLVGAAEGNIQDDKEKIAHLSVQEGLERLKWEMDMRNSSSVDMVVIVAEDGSDISAVQGYAHDRRGQVFRSDVPVEVMTPTKSGSANVYFEALQFVRDRMRDEDFLDDHDELAGRNWEDIRVMFIFHSHNEEADHSILDLAVINGYRAVSRRKNPELNQGGHIIIYSRDAYFGPTPNLVDKDINLLGDWVSQAELKTLGLLNINFVPKGIHVKDIQEKLDIESLHRNSVSNDVQKEVLKKLERNYDIFNETLRQFPALIGVMAFSTKTVKVLGRVLDGLEGDPVLWSRLSHLHMTRDILNGLLISEGEVLADYLNQRVYFSNIQKDYEICDPEQVRPFFLSYYKMLLAARASEGDDLSVNSFLPHPAAAEVIHVKGAEDLQRVRNTLQMTELRNIPQVNVAQNDNSQTTELDGGLDLSGAGERIVFKGDLNPVEIDPGHIYAANPMRFMALFRGFDFRITDFHPVQDPMIFLQKSF